MADRCVTNADFFALTREAMVVCDLGGQIQEWNPAAEELYGWRKEAVVGRDLDELLGTRDAVGQSLRSQPGFRGSVTRTCRRGVRLNLDLVRREAPGTGPDRVLIDAVLLSGVTEDFGDDYYEIIFQTMPIALYRIDGNAGLTLAAELSVVSEPERHAFLEAHPEKVEQMARLAVISEANQRGAELLGAASPEEIRGHSILQTWSARMDTYRRSLIARLRNEIFEEETQVVSLDGRVFDVIFAMAPVQHAGRRFTLVGMVDITDRRRAEAELARLQADFTHAARIATLGELTASLAHEVSQPLSAIRLSCETAQRWLNRSEPNLEQTKLQLGRATEQARRAADVIARVRAMAVAGSARKRVHDLNEILADALALVSPQARGAEVKLVHTVDLAERLIVADRVEIEQVIVNLVVNAIQALEMDDGGDRRIEVNVSSSSGEILCTIADTGPGITDEANARLFDRFYTTKTDGMGLGLAICRTIMEAHGGSITAGNRADRPGAVFAISLPAADAEQDDRQA